jgi:hypothetical protein
MRRQATSSPGRPNENTVLFTEVSALRRQWCTLENYWRKEWKSRQRIVFDLTSHGGTRAQPVHVRVQHFDEVVQQPLGFCCL